MPLPPGSYRMRPAPKGDPNAQAPPPGMWDMLLRQTPQAAAAPPAMMMAGDVPMTPAQRAQASAELGLDQGGDYAGEALPGRAPGMGWQNPAMTLGGTQPTML